MSSLPRGPDEAVAIGDRLHGMPWSRRHGLRAGRDPGTVSGRTERIALIALPTAVLVAGVVQWCRDPSLWATGC